MKPFLKYPGGKTVILHHIDKHKPRSFNAYFEPFLGGGSVFLHLKPERAYLSDSCLSTILCWWAVKYDPVLLMKEIDMYYYDKELYYQTRDEYNKKLKNSNSIFDMAAMFIYLNHTCFNGLVRFNSKGEFNTPFGQYTNPKFYDRNNLLKIHHYIKSGKVKIEHGDFEHKILDKIQGDDFVYFDPPYDGGFDMFTPEKFSYVHQKRLSRLYHQLKSMGVKAMLSNSSTMLINSLYDDTKKIEIEAPRTIAADGEKRKNVKELLMVNY